MTTSKVKLSTDHVLKGLDELRDQELLCDVHLVAGGAKFPAHRVVLAAASPYFQAMFTGGFKENQMKEITLNDTTSQGLECVLDAIYTGEISLSEENVHGILPLVTQMQLNEMVKCCERFVVANISAENCLPFLSAAEKFDLQEAVDVCNTFILENFDTISHSMEFTDISKEQLCKYLSDNQLKVRNGEIEVFRATVKWFQANRSAKTDDNFSDLAYLMQHVRFPLIPTDFLLDEILTSGLISENTEVMRMVTEALRFHSNLFSQPIQESKQFQPRGQKMLALIGHTARGIGQLFVASETKMNILNITGDVPFRTQFSDQVLPVAFQSASLSVVTMGNYLFIFGADAEYLKPTAVRFDVKTNTWLDLKPPPDKASVGKAAALLKNNIYLLGGALLSKDDPNTLNTYDFSTSIARYSTETNSWSKLKNLPKPAVFHCAASSGNYVFSAGGYLSGTCSTDKLYAFDICGKIWLSKTSMRRRRAKFSMEAVGAKLVACGGETSPNVEIYDVTDDQWTLIQNEVLTNHHFPSTIVLNGKVYVIGGAVLDEDGNKSDTDYVSCVDLDNVTIRQVFSIPFRISRHACALLTVPNTIARPQSVGQ